MNKKFMRIISVVLSVMMLFGCVITVSAEGENTETPPAVERITVTVRVEGLSKQLAEKKVSVDKSSTVKTVIDAANIDVVYEENSLVIKSVKGEQALTSTAWQYAVDGTIKTDAIDTFKVEKNCEIVLYNASPDAVYPSINAENVEKDGVITFTGADKNGTVAPIAKATITWETKSGVKTFTTDAEGKIYLGVDDITAGKHEVSINKLDEYSRPVVVRLDEGTEIDVPEYEAEDKTTLTLFEQVYNFLYEILKGIIDVWAFYLNAIGGLLGIGK